MLKLDVYHVLYFTRSSFKALNHPENNNTLSYYKDKSVLLENKTFVKFIRNHIRDTGGVFSISSVVKISTISLTPSLSRKLYSSLLVYDRNTFRSSSKVLGMFGNVRVTFGQNLENLRKSSENYQICCHQHVYITKGTLHVTCSSKI